MWKGQKVSVIFPAYNEENSIASTLQSLLETFDYKHIQTKVNINGMSFVGIFEK